MEQRKTMFNRCLALMLVLVLSFALMPAADMQAKTAKATVSMKAKSVMKYTLSLEQAEKDTVYYNGKSDIPYFELDSRRAEMEANLKSTNPAGLTLSSKVKGNVVTWTRKSNYGTTKVVFDYKKNTITFDDVNDFFRQEGLSLVGAELGMRMVLNLFQADEGSNYSRHGGKYAIDLNKYGIKLLKDKKKFYIPVQTYSDLFISKQGCYQVFNGENLFLSNDVSLTAMKEKYNEAPKKKFSKEFAAFNYGELCLCLDFLYGLKESHDIKTFDQFFTDANLASAIKDQNSGGTDIALYTAVNCFFDDLHCAFGCPSWNTDFDQLKSVAATIPQGAFRSRIQGTKAEMAAYRAAKKPDGFLPYEEVGDTAYITFDEFTMDMTADHTVLPTDADLPNLGKDTLRLVQYAVNKINNNSNIKNVVLDLSLNGGGMVFTADYLLAAFLGTSSMATKDTVTGAQSMVNYKVDTNLDGVFDEKDTLANKGLNLYCLTSGYCYSCANMVPAMFKDSGKVTLIGRTTGGGSCAVIYGTSASGAVFQLSSPMRFSFSKNGGFYDVDRGAEPDVFMKDMSNLYDRQYMNKFIADLK